MTVSSVERITVTDSELRVISVSGERGPQGATGAAGAAGADADVSALLVKANNLSDIADAETARRNLDLGDAATRDVGTGAGTVAAGDDSRLTGALQASGNLAAIADAAKARQNLGLGTMATAAASDYLSKAGNLSGIADPAAARTNLGLGTMATASASAYAALSGATFTAATMIDGSADAIQLRVQGHSAQASKLATFEDYLGNEAAYVSSSGVVKGVYLAANTTNLYGATVAARCVSAGTIGQVILLAAGQTANGFELRNSSSSVLASISAAGLGTFNGVTVAAGYDINAAHAAAGTTRYGTGAIPAAATGLNNTAYGTSALTSLTSGASNVALGRSAMFANTTGLQNVAVGQSALYSNVTGIANTAVGFQSMLGLDGGSYNTAFGWYSLTDASTASNVIALGYSAGRYSTTQSNELFINSINRTNRAGDIAGSIIYGVQNATPANQTLTLNALVTPTYGLKWLAGLEQTTVGAAGGASALPGTPTKYLKVVDSSGATLVIPAYAA